MRTLFLVFSILVFSTVSSAQTLSEYSLKFEPVTLSEFAGVQSFSWAKSGDEVLIIGGRLDGLHRRQPFASFDSAGHNNQLIVINLKTLEVWKRPVSEFGEPIASQLKATNHCFHQQNDTMLIIGGYGIDENTKKHVTFTDLLSFSVSEMISYAKGQAETQPLIFRLTFREEDKLTSRYTVTGGQLNYLNGFYYLVGGHNFQGRYNPNDMPTFTQTYLDGMVRFKWNDYNELNVFRPSKEEQLKDSLLHKRDFNLVKVQHVKDTNYLVALSGVFQYDENLPFQNAVQITPEMKLREYPDFRQLYNQYECADFAVFDSISKTTNVFMIGGISNFYDSLGVLAQNDDVPFVPTLSRLLFAPDGTIAEYLLPNKLPQLIGSGAAFIPNDDKRWKDGFFNWSYTDEEEIFVGYMLGGILANQPSTFWYTEGEASSASNGLFKVYLQKRDELPKMNTYSKHPLNVRCELNYKGRYDILFVLPNTQKVAVSGKNLSKVTVTVKDKTGKVVKTKELSIEPSSQTLKKLVPHKTGIYEIEIKVENRPLWTWKQYLYVE